MFVNDSGTPACTNWILEHATELELMEEQVELLQALPQGFPESIWWNTDNKFYIPTTPRQLRLLIKALMHLPEWSQPLIDRGVPQDVLHTLQVRQIRYWTEDDEGIAQVADWLASRTNGEDPIVQLREALRNDEPDAWENFVSHLSADQDNAIALLWFQQRPYLYALGKWWFADSDSVMYAIAPDDDRHESLSKELRLNYETIANACLEGSEP